MSNIKDLIVCDYERRYGVALLRGGVNFTKFIKNFSPPSFLGLLFYTDYCMKPITESCLFVLLRLEP